MYVAEPVKARLSMGEADTAPKATRVATRIAEKRAIECDYWVMRERCLWKRSEEVSEVN